jgi:intracellular sulfur oxidation DsrE/DsrF family protein
LPFLDGTLPRRRFLGRLSAALPLAALTLGARPRDAEAEPITPSPERSSAQPRTGPPDETWLERLRGQHRMVFDVEAHTNGHSLGQAQSVLDAYQQDYGVPQRDVNLVMGVRGTGIPIVLADAVWAKYRLGEHYAIPDPATKSPATRNLFTSTNARTDGPVTAAQTVEALQRRGVLFLVCNNTVQGATKKLSAAGLGAPEAIRSDILGGLLPGVVLVPAMVIALTRMQERGFSYVYAG